MRISDWSSDVCSSDLIADEFLVPPHIVAVGVETVEFDPPAGISAAHLGADIAGKRQFGAARDIAVAIAVALDPAERLGVRRNAVGGETLAADPPGERAGAAADRGARAHRSEEHTSELQSLMRTSY